LKAGRWIAERRTRDTGVERLVDRFERRPSTQLRSQGPRGNDRTAAAERPAPGRWNMNAEG
jgi:hypothetical protein